VFSSMAGGDLNPLGDASPLARRPSFDVWLAHDLGGASTADILSRCSGDGWLDRLPVKFREPKGVRPVSSFTVATLARLLKDESMLLKSPPRSSEKSWWSSWGGVAVATVEAVCARDLFPGVCGS
jgi:hypothetical protein